MGKVVTILRRKLFAFMSFKHSNKHIINNLVDCSVQCCNLIFIFSVVVVAYICLSLCRFVVICSLLFLLLQNEIYRLFFLIFLLYLHAFFLIMRHLLYFPF